MRWKSFSPLASWTRSFFFYFEWIWVPPARVIMSSLLKSEFVHLSKASHFFLAWQTTASTNDSKMINDKGFSSPFIFAPPRFDFFMSALFCVFCHSEMRLNSVRGYKKLWRRPFWQTVKWIFQLLPHGFADEFTRLQFYELLDCLRRKLMKIVQSQAWLHNAFGESHCKLAQLPPPHHPSPVAIIVHC